MQVYQIIEELASTRSRNEKDRILAANKDNESLRSFFKAALDPFNTYFIKKIPTSSGRLTKENIGLEKAISMLDSLKDRAVTGNAAIEYVANILGNVDENDADLIRKIIKKDPDCGVSRETVNKVWANLIPVYPVLLCNAYSKKAVDALNWKAGVYVQLKSDGARCNIVIDENGGVELFSRQGRPIDVKGRFDYLGEKFKSVMIDGELLYRSADGTASRKVGNGIVNKAIKGTISEEEAASLYLMAWDVIPLEAFKAEKYDVGYKQRFESLAQYVDNDGIVLTPTKIVHSIEEAFDIYKEYRDMDLEGAILKDLDALWSATRSKKQVKLKAEIVSTLRVVDYQEGRDQFEGLMGALICESSDGKVRVSVGGGWSLDMRAQIAADYHCQPVNYTRVIGGIEATVTATPSGKSEVIGQLLDVLHNGLVDCGGEWSLYLPRANIGDFRYDAASADSFEDIEQKK